MKKIFVLVICILLLSFIPAAAADEAFTNGDFSLIAADGYMPQAWSIGYGSKAVPGVNIFVLTNQYEGKNALRLYDPNDTGDAHYKHMTVGQGLTGLTPGAEYTITGYSKLIKRGTSQGGVIKVTCGGEEHSVTAYYSAEGVWEKQSVHFVVPEGVTTASVLVRLVGGGEIYWADISVECTKRYISSFETDAIFYYSEQTTGKATLTVNPYLAEASAGGKAVFSLKDNGNILWSAEAALSGGKASVSVPLRFLSVMKKAYTISASLRNASGTEIESNSFSVYRYPRPSMLSADGKVTVNGKEIQPVFAYHVRKKHYQACADAGINIVQNAKHTTVQGYIDMLDGALDENGDPIVYMLLPIYNGMKPAGHPANIELTRAVAASETVRNHPAFFGYIVMDEPFLNMENPEEHLERAYVAIRAHDDVHPVFIMENYETKYGVTVKYCDILGADIYAGSAAVDGQLLSEGVYEYSKLGKAAADMQKKPFWVLLQTFDYKDYFPTAEELRGQMYQTMLAGADTIGFYCIEDAKNKVDLNDLPIWQDIKTMVSGGELALLRKHRRASHTEGEEFIARFTGETGSVLVQLENRTMEERTFFLASDSDWDGYRADSVYGDAIAAGIIGSMLYVTLPPSGGGTLRLVPQSGSAPSDTVMLGETVSVALFGENTGATEDVRASLAFYTSDGEMTDFITKTGTLGAQSEYDIPISDISVPLSYGRITMKVFLWKNGIMPVWSRGGAFFPGSGE